MNLKNVIEPRMDTDETRINNTLSDKPALIWQVECESRVSHVFICVYPCPSVADKGF
jgi:hypothetical protein